ncbi:MAG: hypothetical protein K0R38_3952 [Polyangiaceae bacterium]|jgi:hypothetical protein|nr:hypothetical protein [Polyangiaceae bacterium]
MVAIPPSPARSKLKLTDFEVEPLSEARWSKIEQGVFARLDRDDEALSAAMSRLHYVRRPAAHFWWSAVAAAATCVLVAWLAWHARSEPALSRISTGISSSHVVLPGVVLDVAPGSAVLVSGSSGDSQLLVLDRGEVACNVTHRRSGSPFVVQAGEVRVEVIGTRFRVVREGDAARVSVQEGVVRVSSRGQSVRVLAGQSWPPAALAPSTRAASPATANSAAVEPEREDPGPSRSRPSSRRTSESRAVASPDPPPRSLQADFEAAARLEARNPRESIRLYSELENGTSSWAQNALYAHGRLEAARGSRSEARRVLTQYLRRFPSGANADDARRLLQRLE